jgi:hypothetical protein
MRLGWPTRSSTSSTSWTDIAPVGSTRTPLRKRFISATEPPKSLGKLLVWRRRARIEIAVMTLSQLTETGRPWIGGSASPPGKPVSLSRTVQAPAAWVVVSQVRLGEKERGCSEMLIIGFGVTEVLLPTLVFTCETCGNHAPHQLTKQNRKFSLFFIPLFSVGTKYLDSCTACGRIIEVSKEQAEAAARQVGPDLR